MNNHNTLYINPSLANVKSVRVLVIFIILSIGKNIALWKSTNQSSAYSDGFNHFTSDKAVDGNGDGNFGSGTCTHTATDDTHPTWNVNLENAYYIVAIKIKNRNDHREYVLVLCI